MSGQVFSPTRWGGRELAWGTKTFVMAILNATPDSFSGDGLLEEAQLSRRSRRDAVAAGADLIDIGAESTRPGHEQVDAAVEIERLLPVLAAVASRVSVPISVDTSKASVAAAALDAGASIINDVRGLQADPGHGPTGS